MADHAAHVPGLAHHFVNMEQQKEAGTIGMWLFLLTEIMFFGGLFLAYSIFRAKYPDGFLQGSHLLNVYLGGLNTVVLIVSSLTMATAVYFSQLGERKKMLGFMAATLVLGTVFCTVAGYFGIQPMLPAARAGQGMLTFGQLHLASTLFFAVKIVLLVALAWRAVQRWPQADVVALLKTGVAPQASVIGPMAEVVFRSTQYLSDADARAMAVYLQALPQHAATPAKQAVAPASVMERGAKVYEAQCAQCHGAQGQGAGMPPRVRPAPPAPQRGNPGDGVFVPPPGPVAITYELYGTMGGRTVPLDSILVYSRAGYRTKPGARIMVGTTSGQGFGLGGRPGSWSRIYPDPLRGSPSNYGLDSDKGVVKWDDHSRRGYAVPASTLAEIFGPAWRTQVYV